MEEIIIEIENGNAKISVKGVKGRGCRALTESLENALGEVTSTKATSEMSQMPVAAKGKAVQR